MGSNMAECHPVAFRWVAKAKLNGGKLGGLPAEVLVGDDGLKPEQAKQLAEICQMCCDRVRAAVALLTNIKQPEAILKTCEEIDRLESDADRVMRSAMSKLFRDEADVKQLIKLRTIYELLETITDRCEDVANIIEGIVLENS